MRKIATALLLFSLLTSIQAQDWEQLNDAPFHKHHSNGFGVNGKGYVLEGTYENDGPDFISNEFWEYTPETDSWVRLDDFPGQARAIAIGDDWNGKYYYGFGSKGGQDGLLNDLWVFDPADGSFTALPSCPCQGRTHPAMIAHNSKIFVGSGSTSNGDLKDWWEYDMITQQWTQKADIPGQVRHHPFQFAIGDDIFVGGGHANNWAKYNSIDETWTAISDYPEGRVAGSQFNYNNKGYVLGGDDEFHNHVPSFQTFLEYDPLVDDWTELPALPNGSRWAPSSFIIEDQLYFFGGLSGNIENDSTVWVFDLSSLEDPVSTTETVEGIDDQIQVAPNPFQDKIRFENFEVSNHAYSISVVNALGKMIYRKDTFFLEDEIDLSVFPKGIYFIVLKDSVAQKSFRVVKE